MIEGGVDSNALLWVDTLAIRLDIGATRPNASIMPRNTTPNAVTHFAANEPQRCRSNSLIPLVQYPSHAIIGLTPVVEELHARWECVRETCMIAPLTVRRSMPDDALKSVVGTAALSDGGMADVPPVCRRVQCTVAWSVPSSFEVGGRRCASVSTTICSTPPQPTCRT